MVEINTKYIPDVEFLNGSTNLILGSEELAGSFLNETIYKHSLQHGMGWLYPETVRYRNFLNIDEDENVSWSESSEFFLEIPREIFYQTLGKKICFGGDIVFVKGVTSELVEKFNNQNSDGYKERYKRYIEQMIMRNNEFDIEYEEYEDEYPKFDEFGNINKISWLSDFAMYAENFSKRHNVDVFLNLEWNKSQKHLPSMFLGLFDRIYKFRRIGKKSIRAIQVK